MKEIWKIFDLITQPPVHPTISPRSILKRWYRSWRKDIRRREEQRVLDDARTRREAQGNDLPESLMCVVCCGLRDVLLVPCRHVCVCSECALKLNPRVCPVCRTDIERIQPVFYSWSSHMLVSPWPKKRAIDSVIRAQDFLFLLFFFPFFFINVHKKNCSHGWCTIVYILNLKEK